MDCKIKTIFEDNDLLVLEKPAGIETVKGPSGKDSIESLLESKIKVERSGIVHRLDKDTSGILLVAKNQDSYRSLKKQFRENCVRKKYLALILGSVIQKGRIESYLSRDPKRKYAIKSSDFISGIERGKARKAITLYRPLKYYSLFGKQLTLLELELKTGRTHQIRVQLRSISKPILGDKMYYNKESKKTSQKLNVERQFLHAAKIKFYHPRSKDEIEFESHLPAELESIIKKLKPAR